MRCSTFHPSCFMAVNARGGHVAVKRLQRQESIYPEAGAAEKCQARPTVTKWDN